MFAIISTGGKQYIVKEGQSLLVEKLESEQGKFTFDKVLLVGDDKAHFGAPMLVGAKVEATILEQTKGKKVVVRKFKNKVRYRRKTGHRQPYTKVRIDKIVLGE